METQRVPAPRVLFVTYVVPWNPRYGGAMRCDGVIKGLAERCDLHVAFAGAEPSVEAFQTWPTPQAVTRHILSPDPGWEGTADLRASRSLRAILGRGKYHIALLRLLTALQPDLVWYFEVEAIRRTALPRRIPAILDHCDVRWRKQMRYAQIDSGRRRGRAMAKAAFLRADDVLLALRVRHSVVASPDEINLLWPARTVSLLPNGFDFPATAPQRTAHGKRLLFFGSLFYRPNADGVRWLCREIWPEIRVQEPGAQLDIVGLGYEALAELADIPGVTFHGFVDDLDPLMQQAAALVVPLRVAGGTRIKILEAWAKGLPIVSTTVGAEGLVTNDTDTVVLGDTAEAFADGCVEILRNNELGKKLARAGYEFGRRKFDWPVVHLGLDAILRQGLG